MLSSTLRLRFFLRSISCRPVSDKNYLFDPFVLSTSALCVRVACRVARLVSRLQVCSTYFMCIRSKYIKYIIIRLAAGTEKQLGPKYPGNMREYPGSRQRGKCLTPVGNFFWGIRTPKNNKTKLLVIESFKQKLRIPFRTRSRATQEKQKKNVKTHSNSIVTSGGIKYTFGKICLRPCVPRMFFLRPWDLQVNLFFGAFSTLSLMNFYLLTRRCKTKNVRDRPINFKVPSQLTV